MLLVFGLLMSAVPLLCDKIILTLAISWPQVDIYLFSDWKH